MSAPQNLSVSGRFSSPPGLARISLPKTIAAIFLLSATIQLLVGWLLFFRSSVGALDFDEQEYWELSRLIMAGLPMEIGRRTMAHPLLLAGLRSIAGNLWFVQSAIAVLAATAPPLLALVVHKLTRSQMAAVVAGIALALWPVQIFYASSLYSETIALPVFLLFLLVLPLDGRGGRPAHWSQWVLAGAILGINAHIRPMYQLFVPVLLIILWLDARRFATAIGRFGLLIAGFAMVVLPWSFYVSRELGRPILLSANGGETLAGGFNRELIDNGERPLPLPQRSTWDGPGKWIQMGETGYLSAAEESLPYVQKDQLLRQRTAVWIKDNPGDASYLALRKLTYMWAIYPFAMNGWRQAVFGNLPTFALMILFFVALREAPVARRRCARLYMLPLFVSGVALISWGSWRFRLPADAGMIGVVAIWAAARMRGSVRQASADIETVSCTTR